MVILFVFGIVCLRIAGRRTFAQYSPLDIIVAIVVGSNISRIMTGKADFMGGVAATLLIVLLHRMVAMLCLRWPSLGRIIKGRAVILITDGVDSRGLSNWVDPLLAARQADRLGVAIYGIGVGNPNGTATQRDAYGSIHTMRLQGDMLPDMGRLEAIAKLAGGKAFAATDRAGLTEVFNGISALQPTPHTMRQRDDFADRWLWPLLAGAILAALALLTEPRLRGIA